MVMTGVRGFNDILPPETALWQRVEAKAREILENFGYQEVRIPILEKAQLFSRSIGPSSDIVEKEMYTFPDRQGNLLTLRPEATASIVRAYVEHRLYAKEEVAKLYCLGPMFRYERPQKGRYRQFYQIDAEVLGVVDPMVDAEVLRLLTLLLDELKVPDIALQVNSLGCQACRPAYRDKLKDFFAPRFTQICQDCQRRFEQNPLRIMDCKQEKAELLSQAPAPLEHLCEDCQKHFSQVKEYLKLLEVSYEINPRMVRGLDYYTRTAFELTSAGLGAQNAVAAGGRYDLLIKELGGPDLPGLGFAIGMERLVSLLSPPGEDRRSVFIAPLGEAARREALKISSSLSREGVCSELGYGDKSLKSQMRRAQKLNAVWVVILGEEELAQGCVILRNMDQGQQRLIPLEEVAKYLMRSLSGCPRQSK